MASAWLKKFRKPFPPTARFTPTNQIQKNGAKIRKCHEIDNDIGRAKTQEAAVAVIISCRKLSRYSTSRFLASTVSFPFPIALSTFKPPAKRKNPAVKTTRFPVTFAVLALAERATRQ